MNPPAAYADVIETLRAEYGDRVSAQDLVGIVRSIVTTVRGTLSVDDRRVYGELQALAAFIDRAKREITEVRCEEIPDKHIPLASVELDAIGSHLEEATGNILDACEQIETLGGTLPAEAAATLGEAVTRIYEACSFQDLTGQRITKIVTTLQAIEERIGHLLKILGHDRRPAATTEPAAPVDTRSKDDALLNGPAIPGSGNSQADIDALFAA